MFSPVTDIEAIEYRKRELLREAKLYHLMRNAQTDKAKVHERFLALVGDLMISGGSRLKTRYTAAHHTLSTPTAYQIKPQNF
jgi:hypothetical protein